MDDESSIPPNAPQWMSDLLGRIDALVNGQQDLVKLYRDLYDVTHALIAGQRREIDDLHRRIRLLEARLDIAADTERPSAEHG